jgi:hypothetical protein
VQPNSVTVTIRQRKEEKQRNREIDIGTQETTKGNGAN